MTDIDRLSIRQRPTTWPIIYQTWDKLVFMHWQIPAEQLRPLIHPRLEIDTFEATAWIAITPLTIRRVRPPLVPPLPLVSQTHELNVRTYVHLNGQPGVWFFSLDASNRLAVWFARIAFGLPYFHADIELVTEGDQIRFGCQRTHTSAPPALFESAWTLGEHLPPAQPDSLEFFLTERYCLYTATGDRIYRARIHHEPWPLRRADVSRLHSTMIESHGLSTRGGPPLLHAQAKPLLVETWPPESV